LIARFDYAGDFIEIKDFFYHAEDDINGNPYNTVFNLAVSSGDFSGCAPCEYDIKEFRRFIDELENLYNFKMSEVLLDDICYGSKVKFLMNKTGKLEISGEIFGCAAEHSLKFVFLADQTALKSFIAELKEMIEV